MKFFVDSLPSVDMESNDKDDDYKDIGVDFSLFTQEGGAKFKEETPVAVKAAPKKRTTKEKVVLTPDKILPDDNDYLKSFNETNSLLRGSIAQTDQLSNEIKEDLDTIRSSKTLKNKYTYVTNLTASSASLISTKIAAIKEINNTISQSHRLTLDRMKALRESDKDQSDDARMMDLYKAFVNTPVGTYQSPNIPSISDMALPAGSNNLLSVPMGDLPDSQLTPEQVRMRMENNPNIMAVVKFNQSTGQRYFDVIDTTNGQSIPNYPRPDAFLLENTTIDIHSMSARNKNIDTVWPLILIGDGDVSEY
jgi:hypothetical protein